MSPPPTGDAVFRFGFHAHRLPKTHAEACLDAATSALAAMHDLHDYGYLLAPGEYKDMQAQLADANATLYAASMTADRIGVLPNLIGATQGVYDRLHARLFDTLEPAEGSRHIPSLVRYRPQRPGVTVANRPPRRPNWIRTYIGSNADGEVELAPRSVDGFQSLLLRKDRLATAFSRSARTSAAQPALAVGFWDIREAVDELAAHIERVRYGAAVEIQLGLAEDAFSIFEKRPAVARMLAAFP